MDTIFTLKDNDNSEKINLDDLYEKKKQHDINKITLYSCSFSLLVFMVFRLTI